MDAGPDYSARTRPVAGRTVYLPPVFQKIVRHALADVGGLRLEPLGSAGGGPPWRRGRVLARLARHRLRLAVPVQAERGRSIPELAAQAQAAVSAEVRRVLGRERVAVDLRVRGLYAPQREPAL